MTDEEQEESRRQALWQAMQQWPSNPQSAIDLIRPLADEGDLDATVLLAYILMQQGRASEGIPFANRAIDQGAAFLAANYAGHLVATADRAAGIEMLRKAQMQGYPVDPLAYAPQMAQAGDMEAALTLLEAARSAPTSLPIAEERFTSLMDQIQAAQSGVTNSVAAVNKAASDATESIASTEQELREERDRVGELVTEVSGLVHEVAADHLAKEYAEQAKKMEDSAKRYTASAIIAGVLTIGAAIASVVLLFGSSADPGAIFSKFAFTLPLIAFAAYLGGLAASHRRMAWHWRHIELQIRTAEPFIAGLDDADRKSLLALLAMRFFPGQTLDPTSKADETSALDLSTVVDSFMKRKD